MSATQTITTPSGSQPSTNPKPQITVRKATVDDAAAIAKIGEETFRASFAWSMPADHCENYLRTEYNPSAIAAELTDTLEKQFFVAVVPATSDKAEQVGGFICMKLGTTEPCLPAHIPQAELNRIYVSNNFIGMGLGSRLIEVGIEWAREHVGRIEAASEAHGVQVESAEKRQEEGKRAALWLGVWQENEKARRLYARYGFVHKMGTHDFVMGDTTQTDDIYLKWL